MTKDFEHHMTIEEIRRQYEAIDLQLRPYAIFCNPINKDITEEAVGDKLLVISTPYCSTESCFIVNRTEFNNFTQSFKLMEGQKNEAD
jgi:hypothetical protein